ncbi:monocarboxylate transporter 5-like [Mizuhopecten yessoensis]|uniref:Monocarboxylate transporter 5 n=1 Tax=Mizuhopecten yessoensis TaxID=6573 RepID=A0A210QXZ3_MIZYE|nr:monocarboxylate transporter 5-like [Mizuhopecten yessoensis]XP_021346907.1 monocarboxylate transporter 5-like [Mizuhopecten yessoensis]OWF53585.1 Monocarboxylate transporter 5 [Mizuhopecten yessoensis]
MVHRDSLSKDGMEQSEKEVEEAEGEEEGGGGGDDPYNQTDHGWAWMVLLAATLESFMIVGFLRSFGIFFVEFLNAMDASASVLSMSLSIQTLMFSVLSLVTLSVCDILNAYREFVIFGGFLACLSYFLSSFVETPELLILTIGFIFGTSAAFAHGPTTVMLGKYFDKRRGMANAVMNFGGSFGGLVLPNLFRYLLDTYALQGTLWVVSGLLLHIMVTGALLRPLKPHPRKRNKLLEENGEKDAHKMKDLNEVTYKQTQVNKASVGHSYDKLVTNQRNRNAQGWNDRRNQILQAERRRTVSDSGVAGHVYPVKSHFHKSSELHQGMGDALGSLGNIHLTVSPEDDEDNFEEDDSYAARCHKLTCKHVLGSILDLKLLKNKMFVLNLICSMCSVFGLALIVTYLPHHAKDVGMSDRQITLLLTIIGSTDLLNKLILVFIADNKKIKRHFLVAGCLIITGAATVTIPYCTEFWSLAVYSVIYGIFHGTFFAMLAVLVVDFAGIENISQGLAITMLSHGISIFSMNPVIGAIRDNLHSYNPAFYLMGSFMLFGGFLLFLEPKIRRYEERKKKEEIQTEL